jgi:hypothetical protein
LAGHVARTGEALVLTDAATDPRFHSTVDGVSGMLTKGMLVLPLFTHPPSRGGGGGAKVLGVLALSNRMDGSPFGRREVEALGDVFALVSPLLMAAAAGGEEEGRWRQALARAQEEATRLQQALDDSQKKATALGTQAMSVDPLVSSRCCTHTDRPLSFLFARWAVQGRSCTPPRLA